MSSPPPTTAQAHSATTAGPTDHLVTEEFLRTLIGMRALKSALELGVIDELAAAPATTEQLARGHGADRQGIRLLVDLLAAEGIVAGGSGKIALTERFVRALQYRDLLDAKLDFVGFVLLDFVDRFNSLVADPERFMRESQVFRLFDYQRSLEPTAENYAWTKVWMRFTTVLTKYEAGACLDAYDFAAHRRMLDIGGNSGEFALRVCRACPELRATVMDLPLVCEFGQDHVLAEPERSRIGFLSGSAFERTIPAGYDLIVFKSMLHDWPEPDARRLLKRAAEALEPGGALMIFERAPLDFSAGSPPLSLLPLLLFARSYREPSMYETHLADLGLSDIEVHDIALETPFFLLTARKAT